MKATKTYNLGEWCIGGTIRVEITGKVVQIKVYEYKTKNLIQSATTTVESILDFALIEKYLNEITSYGHADDIMGWIITKINL